MKHLLSLSWIKFCLTGVLNTVVGLGSIYALKWYAGVGDFSANFFGYVLGFAVSTYVNARWTFQYRQALAAVIPRYAAVILLAYLVNLGCIALCIHLLRINSYLAHAIGMVPYATLTYAGLRRFVFVGELR